MSRDLVIEKRDHLAIFMINRPDKLNSLTKDLLQELRKQFVEINKDDEVYVILLTGCGEKAFAAGADIKQMLTMTPSQAKAFSKIGHDTMETIEKLDKPVIAAVNGYALGGGCELAMACDIRIASKNAKFGQPEVGLGIPTGFGGSRRLTRLVGPGNSKELIFTGVHIGALEAMRIGLINRVVNQEDLMDECIKLANIIMANSRIAVRRSKILINHVPETGVEEWKRMELDAFSKSFTTEDQKEGMSAILEKRRPKFKAN